MKKILVLISLIFLIPGLLTAQEVENPYRTRIRRSLEDIGPLHSWPEDEKSELALSLYHEKISPVAMGFLARNLPDDFALPADPDARQRLVATVKEIDLSLKQGLSAGKIKCQLKEFEEFIKNDSQKTLKMLQYRGEKKSESLENQYRQGQRSQYRHGKRDAEKNGNPNQQAGQQNGQNPAANSSNHQNQNGGGGH